MNTAPIKEALRNKLTREITARKSAERILEDKSRELFLLNRKLASQRDRLDILNSEMKESLAYSKRIQQSLLPVFGINSLAVAEHFILYRPKDIVSGDFYWQHNNEISKKLIVVTADSTGHGVPGAFMSIIGKQGLDLAVLKDDLYDPALILNALNNHLTTFLQKDLNQHIKDGIDLSVYCIDYSNENKKTLSFAGALNPIFICRQNEMIELKADRVAIGYKEIKEKTPYVNQHFELEKGDCIYSFTDGFQDQFGGPDGKKLKKVHLKEILRHNACLSMHEQYLILEELFHEWKGDLEQIDDICLLGVRVS